MKIIGDGMDGEDRGLTIGGYKSAWLADLVASFLLERIDKLLENHIYHGIYYDGRFIIFQSQKNKIDINEWLESFQSKQMK